MTSQGRASNPSCRRSQSSVYSSCIVSLKNDDMSNSMNSDTVYIVIANYRYGHYNLYLGYCESG